MNLSIILPSYKEAENLKVILPKLKDVFFDKNISYEVLVIDTISAMDDTEFIVKSNNCKYFKREFGNNYGDAIRTGLKNAIGDYIVFMDADCSHSCNDIISLYEAITSNKADVVIGSRYCVGGKTNNNIISVAMSKILNRTYRFFLDLEVCDVSNSFRIYKKEIISCIKLECNNFDIIEEILVKLSQLKVKILEIPIEFGKRKYGESKRELLKYIFSYLLTLYKMLKLKKDFKRDK